MLCLDQCKRQKDQDLPLPYPIAYLSHCIEPTRRDPWMEAISTGQGYTKLIVWNSAAHHVLTGLGRTWGTKVARPLLGKEHTANGYKYDILKIIEVASDSEYYLCGWLTESTRNLWLEVCQELNKWLLQKLWDCCSNPILQRRCVMVLCRYVNRIGVCWQTLICLVHTSKRYNNKMHAQSVSSLRESSIATRRADPCCE